MYHFCFRAPSWPGSAFCWRGFEEHYTPIPDFLCPARLSWTVSIWFQFCISAPWFCAGLQVSPCYDKKAWQTPRCSSLSLTPYRWEVRANYTFVPNCHQYYHFRELKGHKSCQLWSRKVLKRYEECPLWSQMRWPRVAASRFRGVCHVKVDSSGQALASPTG